MAIAQRAAAVRRKPTRGEMRQWLEGYLFASPFILGFLIFIAFPMGFSIYLVFQDWNLLTPPSFVGLQNVTDLLADPKLRTSLSVTAIYAFGSTVVQILFAFLLALLLNRKLRFRNFYRTALYLPVIVPIVVSAFIWQRVYHPEFGLLNQFLGWFGVPPQPWLFNPVLTQFAFIFMRMWSMGTMMVIFLAGLQNVPASLLEAAAIDGAGAWQRFRHVALPLLTPIIFFNLVVGLINSFQVFAPALIMTKGGPQDATLYMVLYIYRQGFEYLNMGYAAALSWILFSVILVFTFIQFRFSGRWVYQG